MNEMASVKSYIERDNPELLILNIEWDNPELLI